MTEEKFRWENFTIDLGIDIFEKVDFDPPRPPEEKPPEVPEIPDTGFKLPGFEVPTPGFNWRTFDLAKSNPTLFLKIVTKIIKEVSYRAAQRAGQALDPRNIDFSKFKDGFNLTDYDPSVVLRVKEYLLDKIKKFKDTYDTIDAEGRNISQWRNVTVEDLELTNITWNGQIHGRIKILERPADHYYTNTEKAILFGIVAAGALFFIFPLSWSIRRLGCRKTFTIVGLISAFATALCPLAAYLGFVPFVIVRFIQGIGFAACMPTVGCVTSAWAKLTENGLFNGALTGFIQLAPVITMPMSGLLCASFLGWRAVYYIHAIITLLLIVTWWLLYRDSPSEISPRKVSVSELRQIQNGKAVDGRRKHNTLPLKEIFTNAGVWAVWIAAIGNMYSIQMVVVFAPTFIKEVLKYPIVNVGFAAAFPTLLQFIVKLAAGSYSDKVKLGETPKVRIFNSIAFIGMGTFLILLAIFASQDTSVLAIIFLILSATILGFNTGGFFKSATLIGRQHSHFVNAIVQIIMCVAMLTMPFLVYSITTENTPGQWAAVFIIHAILLFVTNAIFCIFGQGTAAAFTQINEDPNRLSSTKMSNADQTKPIIKEPKFQDLNASENNA
uniref:Major facilitator superfamily (MFS) profile domain-containing protein n=1 Tax=Acrobeloides nanus TaxID=290746 RepID=A0A914E0B3_9BILA